MLRGAMIASAALGLLATPAAVNAGSDDQVKCSGINGCAGKGECHAADGSHDCGGQNSCKGKGWVYVDSAEKCEEEGGTVLE